MYENVALGLPERQVADSEVQEALLQGGAARFITKLRHGPDTILDPVTGKEANFKPGEDVRELKAVSDTVEEKIALSGGETQRLSA